MTPLALYIISGVFGGWIALRLVANERQEQHDRTLQASRQQVRQELSRMGRNASA